MDQQKMKEILFDRIDQKKEEIVARGRAFYDCPEPGFHEVETAKMICRELDRAGITYRKEVGITGVIATVGTGDYHIAIAADMDALPKRSGDGFIHSCGHSIQTADALTAFLELAQFADDPSFDGKVSVFFTPAEELTNPEERQRFFENGTLLGRSGKQHMIAEGDFSDVDCVLSMHASSDSGRTFNVNSVLTGFMTKNVRFTGAAAHSGAAPHLGKNALHGAALALSALAFLKDRFSPEEGVSIHPVIQDTTGGINIIPDEAHLVTYIRAVSLDSLNRASELFDACVKGCGDALGLGVSVDTKPGYLPLHQSRGISEIARENMRIFVDEEHILDAPVSGASGDIGDLGSILPTIQFGFGGIEGQFHTDHFLVEDEEFCYLTCAKVLAGTLVDLLSDPGKRPEKEGSYLSASEYCLGWLKR